MSNCKASEHAHQVTLIQEYDRLFSEYEDLLFAIPNGGKRSIKVALELKKEGVRSGVPDMMLAVAKGGYHGLFIELKKINGRAQPNQKKWQKMLREQGYKAEIIEGWEDAIKEIREYLASGTV